MNSSTHQVYVVKIVYRSGEGYDTSYRTVMAASPRAAVAAVLAHDPSLAAAKCDEALEFASMR